jgi:hypothetical protein
VKYSATADGFEKNSGKSLQSSFVIATEVVCLRKRDEPYSLVMVLPEEGSGFPRCPAIWKSGNCSIDRAWNGQLLTIPNQAEKES